MKQDNEATRKLVVLDIGCRWGFAEKFTQNKDAFRVYGFDPDVAECARLALRYEGLDVCLVPLGLAGQSGKRTLYITHEPACSSLLRPDPYLTDNYPALACARLVSTTEVDTTTLDAWAEQSQVGTIDYIKLDTQGTELEILQGGIAALKSVRCIEVEVEFNPIYLEQAIFSEVDLFLRAQGFVLWKLTNHVHYSSKGNPESPLSEDSVFYDDRQQVKHASFGGQLYWANAHYVKKDVLDLVSTSEFQRLRDVQLFDTLGMPDVVDHLRGKTLA
jgi:FkbM family methyltransferase